jgi:hypothetical protein
MMTNERCDADARLQLVANDDGDDCDVRVFRIVRRRRRRLRRRGVMTTSLDDVVAGGERRVANARWWRRFLDVRTGPRRTTRPA